VGIRVTEAGDLSAAGYLEHMAQLLVVLVRELAYPPSATWFELSQNCESPRAGSPGPRP
jgi:hypothetical protein